MGVVSPGKLGQSVTDFPKTGMHFINSSQFLTLGAQTRAVIFHGLWGPQVSKTLLCVTSHSVNVSSPGCDSS
jgi:hypothetical protein